MWGASLCWLFSATTGFAQVKVEIPRGYADAAPANQKAPAARPALPAPVPFPAQAAPAGGIAPAWRVAPAARAAPAAEGQSVLDLLTKALGEEIDPNVLKLENQYLPKVQQLLRSELAFVKRVCRPDKEQYQEIALAARGWLRPAVREYAVAANQIRKRGARGWAATMPQAGTMLRKKINAIVKATLRPDQVEQYEEECAFRTAHRKRAVVLNLIVKLDEKLGFTPEQRDKLIESLTEGYQESWEQWLQFMHHNADFTPQIPNECVLSVLNEEQKNVWQQLSKTRRGVAVGHFFAQPIAVIEEDLVWEEME